MRSSRHRRGDIFFLQEFVAIAILLFIGVLIFGLFYVSAKMFEDEIKQRKHIDEAFSSALGGEALRVYLATRMDEPAQKFLPKGVAGVVVEAHPLTFEDAIAILSRNETCREALSDYGTMYTGVSNVTRASDYTAVFTEERTTKIPEGLCRDFYLRTLLFMRVLAPRDGFTLTVKAESESFKIGKVGPRSATAAMMVVISSNLEDSASGRQPVRADPSIVAELFIAGGAP